jgi:two-component system sensor histidine kinase QseC
LKRLSLRSRLTLLNLSLMFCVLVPVGVTGYRYETRAMDDLLDGRLAQSGRTIAALISHGARLPLLVERTPDGIRTVAVVTVDHNNSDPEIGYQALDSAGALIVETTGFAGFPKPTDADVGFRSKTIDGTPWRLFTIRGTSGILLRIGERLDTRQDITRSLILEHSAPLIVGLPLLALLLTFAVGQGLRPLRRLVSVLKERPPGNRQPVVLEDATSELRPLIDTLNLQFERLEDALERERRFNADVAHELRTPLAAAMILIESAARTRDHESHDTALANAQASLSRLARRIEQILALARLEMGAAASTHERCDLVGIIKASIEEVAPQIASKDITMGFDFEEAEAIVEGHSASLAAIFRNLIENALRYVDVGGTIDVILMQDKAAVCVDVRDDGPGIPADRRDVVFARFHRENSGRTDGYGLGLSIVRQAARRHDATITLSDSPAGRGLNVRVVIPRAQGRQGAPSPLN